MKYLDNARQCGQGHQRQESLRNCYNKEEPKAMRLLDILEYQVES